MGYNRHGLEPKEKKQNQIWNEKEVELAVQKQTNIQQTITNAS